MDVTVVGSGPNGLAAAVICARAGLSVQVFEAQPTLGGGARTLADPEFPGVSHDICSAVHPLALASPFLAAFDLPARGVTVTAPQVSYANPLPGRPAAVGYHDLDRTCAELTDGQSWRRLLGPLVERDASVLKVLLGDKRSIPTTDLIAAVQVASRLVEQGTPAWRALAGTDARALFTGVAAHTISQMPSLVSSGAGLMLATLAHTVGWPIPAGGSQAIPDALIADLQAHGGTVTSGAEITEPPSGVVLYDTAPTALLSIYGDRLPSRYAKALQRYRFGPGVAKVDFVLSDEIPWVDPRLAEAPTLHMGGTREQMAHAEAEAAAGRHPEWPMVLAALPHLVDPGRIDAAGRRPLWTYAHVPSGSTVDQSETVTKVFERFAPGFRDVVVAVRSIPAAGLADHNANLVGGDIGVGGNTLFHALAGPTPRLNPWSTPIPKAYLCSSATPPGGGVHGMSGYYAARTVLRREFGIKKLPRLAP
ncbi:NAD(P)/FAD-dependent oxidoreductase [Mycobacterium sp. OAE908]|uniref:phytoene desaturase family protein n=1 Tax=Mycobacterium sp. OAE908 TaxID=2817899 RepID=UPI001AE93593